MTPLLPTAEVRAHLLAVQAEPRTNWPVVDGIPWWPFCENRRCRCFVPSGVVACEEYMDVDEDVAFRRCGCCGWTESRHPGPRRIQRKRTKGWRMPPGARYVGRPTVYGNPWALCDAVAWGVAAPDRQRWLVEMYRADLRERRGVGEVFDFADIDRIRHELGGCDLVCWCPIEDDDGRHVPCHADVLLQVSNGAEP